MESIKTITDRYTYRMYLTNKAIFDGMNWQKAEESQKISVNSGFCKELVKDRK
jgi:hypothetical protein